MTGERRPRRRAASVAACVVAFISFFAVSSLVKFVLWDVVGLVEHDELTQKVARAEEKLPLDVLFIGSSYIQVGIDAGLFDKEMAAHGHPLTSYNLGIGGLGFVEIQEVVKQVVQWKNCCKYILVAPMFHSLRLIASSDNVRSIYFMTLPHAYQLLSFVYSAPQVPNAGITRSTYINNIITLMFRHYTNAGLGAAFLGLNNFFSENGNWKLNPNWDSRGYTKLPDKYNSYAPNNYALGLSWMIRDRPGYLARAATDAQPVGERLITDGMVDQVVEMAKQIEATGAIPLVVMPPIVGDWLWQADFSVKFAARCGDSHLLDFDDPVAFPTIFDPAMVYDAGHLNGLGAPVWTRLVAAKIADMRAKGEPAGSFCRRLP